MAWRNEKIREKCLIFHNSGAEKTRYIPHALYTIFWVFQNIAFSTLKRQTRTHKPANMLPYACLCKICDQTHQNIPSSYWIENATTDWKETWTEVYDTTNLTHFQLKSLFCPAWCSKFYPLVQSDKTNWCRPKTVDRTSKALFFG